MPCQIRKRQIPLIIRQSCWVNPVTNTGRDTWQDAIRKYLNYMKGKGPAFRPKTIDEKRRDHGSNTRPKKVQQDMPQISAIVTPDLQNSKIPTTEGV